MDRMWDVQKTKGVRDALVPGRMEMSFADVGKIIRGRLELTFNMKNLRCLYDAQMGM